MDACGPSGPHQRSAVMVMRLGLDIFLFAPENFDCVFRRGIEEERYWYELKDESLRLGLLSW